MEKKNLPKQQDFQQEKECENAFYKSKSSRKAQKEAEEAAEALKMLQEAQQEAEGFMQKRVWKLFVLKITRGSLYFWILLGFFRTSKNLHQ